MIPEDFEEHLGKPINGIGRHAFGVCQSPQSIKSPVNVGTSVDKIKSLLGIHGFGSRLVKKETLPCDKDSLSAFLSSFSTLFQPLLDYMTLSPKARMI
jgi:hypothetical protein